MICTGFRQALIGVLLGGQEFRHYNINFDESLADTIIHKESEFWQHVVEKIPPPASTLSDISQLYPTDSGKSIAATPSILSVLDLLKEAKKSSSEIKSVSDQLELELKSYLEDNSILTAPDGKPLATWKTQTTSRLDSTKLKNELPDIAKQHSKTTDSRVLRLKS
jgi:predicted phage-related endonuclease